MFYILDSDTARKKYKEETSKQLALLNLAIEKYGHVNPDQALINLKVEPYEIYKFINDFYHFDDHPDDTSFLNFFIKLTKHKSGNPYYTTSLGLSLIQDVLDLIYTNNYVNIGKYQFDDNRVGRKYDVFGSLSAFIVGDGYKSPVQFNTEIAKKYKKLDLTLPWPKGIHNRKEDLAVIYSKLSVPDILTLFYNLVTKAPIIKVD